MNESQPQAEKLSTEARSVIKIIFLTLFLDLVGFSIIFPLFPDLIEYYTLTDPNNALLKGIYSIMTAMTEWGGVAETVSPIVLFGGILGALYSFLQFLFAPFWGSLSDKIGRKPVLVLSMIGMILSYFIWMFSSTFSLLILSRIIGGIMGGNISTATAVIGDVTTAKTRSRGMAFVGIAFGMGFIFGPALGALFSQIRLDQMNPNLVAYGFNPFTTTALVAMVLAALNLFFIIKKFKETLPEEKRGQSGSQRSINPVELFKPLPIKAVNLTNFTNFFFLAAFSGMEFTLTFLAKERLNYSAANNGIMFVFIGVLIALVQGGYVRRKAHQVGEKRMALMGLITVLPGLVIIASAYSNLWLYTGLAFLAVGSAMVIPCLTALVSLFADEQTQGRAIGNFRSLGALARVIGPLSIAVIYWRLGAQNAYYIGALALLIPMLILVRIPKPNNN